MEKMERGQNARKTKYDTNVKPYLTYISALARRGLSEEEIAGQVKVSYSTFRKYKSENEELREALAENKIIADCEIENALYQKAKGYTYTAVEKTIVNEHVTEQKEKTVHVPGDVSAQKFWLENRQKEHWQNRQKIEADINIEQMEDLV